MIVTGRCHHGYSFGAEAFMDWNVLFLVNSVMLGIGLAMDAFAVSMANGLHEPKMRLAKMSGVAGVFAFF